MRGAFIARYVGGPKDGDNEPARLQDGRLPPELRCAVLRPLDYTKLEEPTAVVTPAYDEGVYRLKSAQQTTDPEGFPGDMIWTEATYHWKGYL